MARDPTGRSRSTDLFYFTFRGGETLLFRHFVPGLTGMDLSSKFAGSGQESTCRLPLAGEDLPSCLAGRFPPLRHPYHAEGYPFVHPDEPASFR